MKKIRSICLLLLSLLMLNILAPAVLALPDGGAQSCITLDAGKSLAGDTQLLPTAKAAVLYCPQYETMVYSWNPDEPLDPSGMNKIMTALLALEYSQMDAKVSVTANALSSVEAGALAIGLRSGEILTLGDLLYLMMVGSANDAAAVIAEYIGGSQSSFVARMNQRAQELGCTNTVFMNATGLTREGQHTTARDLAKITAEALKLETFVEIFTAKEYTVAATDKTEERKVTSTNYMFSGAVTRDHLDERVIGGKTGALTTTDRSLISIARDKNIEYISVVMNAKGSMTDSGAVRKFGNFDETRLLLDHAFSQYTNRQLFTADKVMGQFSVSGGENDLAVAAVDTVSALMPVEISSDKITYRTVEREGGIQAPVASGEAVGSVELWYEGMRIAQSDLVALHAVREKGTASTLIKPDIKTNDGFGKGVFLVLMLVLGSVVVFSAAVLVIVRIMNVKRMQKRRRENRRRRRR